LIQGGVAYGALLSPQGKILHDMFIHQQADETLIDCDAAGRDDLVAKLKLYRLRAKFEITPRGDLAVVSGASVSVDPRHQGLGLRGIFPAGTYPSGAGTYDARRFGLGIADSAEIGSGRLFPHEANLDLLGGVDFKKGCYIGQEVVSRMQHRGTARSRIMPVTFPNHQYTDEIRAGDQLIGEVLGRRGRQALALLRLDRLEGELPFTLQRPDWMTLP